MLFRSYLAPLVSRDTSGLPDVGYSDINGEHEAYAAINALAAYDVIVGNENGEFRPDDTVTVQEAIKMIVCAMGYESMAKEKGGYPLGYTQIAAAKGITKSTDAVYSEKLQLGQALIMLLNMLESDISDSVFNGILNPAGKTKSNYMNNRLSVYKIKDVVTDNGVTALDGKTSVLKDEIRIGDVVINDVPNGRDLLGKYAEVYYKFSEEIDDRSFLYCNINNSRNQIIKLATSNIDGYENMTYRYQVDEFSQTEKMRLDAGFTVIYNGKAVESTAVLNQELMKPDRKSVV